MVGGYFAMTAAHPMSAYNVKFKRRSFIQLFRTKSKPLKKSG